ncbi:MAG TPA: phenylalanine--tRNA ligase subunit beta [Candidatus Bathyarchaeia archaeon]|nr:phenylalanine--tRNA ligase subunit beta [Candidatus Bathyarchaeia archaeon]
MEKNPLALAGVMGGIGSSITDKTTNIILESANFEPVNIRKTRIEHGLSTESSYRFERDIDPNLAETAAARAIKLIMQFGGKNVNIQTLADIYPKKIKPWQIKLYVDYVNSLLGEKVPVPKIKNILENLGLGVKISKDVLNCEIPTIRLDLKTQEDLVEEIGRIYGYENIPAKLPTVELSSPVENVQRIFEDKLRDAMTTLGFSEMLNYSFYSKEDIEKCNLNIDEHFEVANPMNPDQQYMRTSLIPGILKNVKLNIKNFNKFSIFEIGHKYYEEKNNSVEKIVLDGAFVHKEIYTINTIDNEKPYFELKGKIEALFAALGFLGLEFKAAKQEKFWHPTRTSSILVDGKEVGKLGEVGPKVLASYGIKQRISVFEIGVDKLMEIGSFSQTYESINRFPSVKRDISMFVGESIKYADIEKKIAEAGGKLVLAVELFDIFEKGGEKSMALRIEIGSREKTLTSEEIDGVMKKIIEKLEKDLKVKVRK